MSFVEEIHPHQRCLFTNKQTRTNTPDITFPGLAKNAVLKTDYVNRLATRTFIQSFRFRRDMNRSAGCGSTTEEVSSFVSEEPQLLGSDFVLEGAD